MRQQHQQQQQWYIGADSACLQHRRVRNLPSLPIGVSTPFVHGSALSELALYRPSTILMSR